MLGVKTIRFNRIEGPYSVVILQTAAGSFVPYMKIINSLNVLLPLYGLTLQRNARDYEDHNEFFNACISEINSIESQHAILIGWSFSGALASYLASLVKFEKVSVIAIDSLNFILQCIDIESAEKFSDSFLTKCYIKEAFETASKSAILPRQQYGINDSLESLINFVTDNKMQDEKNEIINYIHKCKTNYFSNIRSMQNQALKLENKDLFHLLGNETNITTSKTIYKINAGHFDMLSHNELITYLKSIIKQITRDTIMESL